MLLLALGGVVLGFAFLLLALLTDDAAWAYACIVVSVVAGVVLVLDVIRRRRPSGGAGSGSHPVESLHSPADQGRPDEGPTATAASSVDGGVESSDPAADPRSQQGCDGEPALLVDPEPRVRHEPAHRSQDLGSQDLGSQDPEPDVEDPTSQEGATVAASDAEVLVVDERPHFHVADCAWLGGRETIPLPAREAVDLGFSPCAVCRPVAALARA